MDITWEDGKHWDMENLVSRDSAALPLVLLAWLRLRMRWLRFANLLSDQLKYIIQKQLLLCQLFLHSLCFLLARMFTIIDLGFLVC